MWKPVEAPGEWLVFLQRKDIKGLPIMEAKKKYMQEQLLFEAYENNLNTVNTVNNTTSAPASAAAGGGGQRKFKYAAQYQLAFRGGGDGGDAGGTYDRVAISDLKRYWYDNFFNSGNGGFNIPPPNIPYNIGSDYFFIKQNETTAALITWGTLGRGRQRGQWTYSEYKILPPKVPADDCYWVLGLYNKWNTFGFGSTNLSTPAGKWSINDVVGTGVIVSTCETQRNPYELTEAKPNNDLPEIISFAGGLGELDGWNGDYSRNGVDDNGNPVWYKGSQKIYYSITCGGWKVDNERGLVVNCAYRIKANSTVEEGPLGTYTYFDPRGGSYTYTATRGVPPPPPPAGSLTVTGNNSSDTTFVGNYIKDPSSGTGQDAIYIREDDAMRIYYNTTCAMWRIDDTGIIRLDCGYWRDSPTGDSPLGIYQLSAVRAPETGTYRVTQN